MQTPLRSSLELDEQAADAEGFREYSVDEADPLGNVCSNFIILFIFIPQNK